MKLRVVEQRELEQWFLRITKYADELLDGLTSSTDGRKKSGVMQRNWIGRSEGALVELCARRRDCAGRRFRKKKSPASTPNWKIAVFTHGLTHLRRHSIQLAPSILW